MKRDYYQTDKDGFYGAYFGNPKQCSKGVILMLGDRIDDLMVKTGVRWLHRNGCNVMTMASDTKDYAYHDYPIESFEKAIAVLKAKGNIKFGIIGASTTAMMALAAASYIPDLTLTVALSPSDFIMEGFYRDGLDGAKERPGNHESTLSYKGKRLPYLPFAYRHPEYWQKLSEEAKRRGDIAAARDAERDLCLLVVQRIRQRNVFIQKKRSEGKCGKEAMIAGLNKFLRVYYGKVMELYSET